MPYAAASVPCAKSHVPCTGPGARDRFIEPSRVRPLRRDGRPSVPGIGLRSKRDRLQGGIGDQGASDPTRLGRRRERRSPFRIGVLSRGKDSGPRLVARLWPICSQRRLIHLGRSDRSARSASGSRRCLRPSRRAASPTYAWLRGRVSSKANGPCGWRKTRCRGRRSSRRKTGVFERYSTHARGTGGASCTASPTQREKRRRGPPGSTVAAAGRDGQRRRAAQTFQADHLTAFFFLDHTQTSMLADENAFMRASSSSPRHRAISASTERSFAKRCEISFFRLGFKRRSNARGGTAACVKSRVSSPSA